MLITRNCAPSRSALCSLGNAMLSPMDVCYLPSQSTGWKLGSLSPTAVKVSSHLSAWHPLPSSGHRTSHPTPTTMTISIETLLFFNSNQLCVAWVMTNLVPCFTGLSGGQVSRLLAGTETGGRRKPSHPFEVAHLGNGRPRSAWGHTPANKRRYG